MSEDMLFFMYLAERYAEYKKMTTGAVIKAWDKLNITDKIYGNYFLYHQEALENAFKDIDSFVATGGAAW